MSDNGFLFPGANLPIAQIAVSYLRESRGLIGVADDVPEGERWAKFHVGNLALMGRAEEAWPIILTAIEMTDDEQTLDFLGAGDLEAILRDHGSQFIERTEAAARTSPRFRRALQGVWAFESPVRERIDAVLDSTGA